MPFSSPDLIRKRRYHVGDNVIHGQFTGEQRVVNTVADSVAIPHGDRAVHFDLDLNEVAETAAPHILSWPEVSVLVQQRECGPVDSVSNPN